MVYNKILGKSDTALILTINIIYHFLVHAVFITETVQTLLTGADRGYWFILGFGNFEHLRHTFLGPIDRTVLNSFVSISVRAFLCYLICTIKKSLFCRCCLIEPR